MLRIQRLCCPSHFFSITAIERSTGMLDVFTNVADSTVFASTTDAPRWIFGPSTDSLMNPALSSIATAASYKPATSNDHVREQKEIPGSSTTKLMGAFPVAAQDQGDDGPRGRRSQVDITRAPIRKLPHAPIMLPTPNPTNRNIPFAIDERMRLSPPRTILRDTEPPDACVAISSDCLGHTVRRRHARCPAGELCGNHVLVVRRVMYELSKASAMNRKAVKRANNRLQEVFGVIEQHSATHEPPEASARPLERTMRRLRINVPATPYLRSACPADPPSRTPPPRPEAGETMPVRETSNPYVSYPDTEATTEGFDHSAIEAFCSA
ncbi:hypothetical protein FB107DRAFT_280289 [Schizophyllum commune]